MFLSRFVLSLLQLGILAVILIALPYKSFDLDRFFVPKELILNGVAILTALACLLKRKRLELTAIDQLLIAFLGLSLVSAVFAQNWWLAGRAVSMSISGILLFWVASTIRRAGLERQLVIALAVAVVAGAATALAQAYFGAQTDLFSLNRAPGGTFGNRNFMAHLSAIGVPVVVLVALSAKSRPGYLLSATGAVLLAAALVLSRSRAAWLALLAGATIIVVLAFVTRAPIATGQTGARLRGLAVAVALGAVAAAFLPNQLEWKSASPYLDSVRGVVNFHEGSGAGRLVQYKNSMSMALAKPLLGVGPGNWAVAYPKYAVRNDPSLSSAEGMTDNPWPSSDWVAFVSERGVIATVCLALALVGLVLRAIRELRDARAADDMRRITTALMLIGTIATTVVVGLFDAVLLLAIPTMFFWLVAGALSAPTEGTRTVQRGVRLAMPVALVALGAIVIARGAMQIAAMSTYSATSRLSALEAASTLDPGSYRIRMRLAEGYVARGDCAKAVPHARAARSLFPNAGDPRAILRRCGVK